MTFTTHWSPRGRLHPGTVAACRDEACLSPFTGDGRGRCACGHLDLEDTPEDEVVLDLVARDGLAHGRVVCRRTEDLEP